MAATPRPNPLSLALLAGGLVGSAGWVTTTVGGSEQPMRWSMPDTSESSSGIGAGISWAIAPDFGEKMVPLFKENNFKLGFDYVTAEALNSAIQRAMFQWANNHKYLTFFNVSDKCAAAEGADCAAAEVFIHAGTGGEAFNGVPLRVSHTYNASGKTVRTTAGELIDAQQIVKSEVRFFTDHPVELPEFRTGQQCFYLDETFCEPFQRAQLTYDAKLIIEVVCFAVWAAAFLMTLKRVSEYFRSYRRKGVEGVKETLRVHTSHILYSYFTMLMLILPPAFYWVAVHPCFLCHSFEGLAVSAIGQVLGFSYVDAPGAQNFKVTEPMSADVCAQPEAHIAETGVDILSVLTMPDPYSANYCLTSSDLSGLYRLYPLCSGAKRTPGCLRSKNNVGYLRLGLAFGVPFCITSLVVFLSLAALRRVEKAASESVKKRLAIQRMGL